MTHDGRWRALIALLIAFMGVESMSSLEGTTDSVKAGARPFYLWYLHQLAEQADNQLTIQEGVGVTAIVHYTQQGFPIRALGAFHLPIGFQDPDLARIGGAIGKYDLAGPKSHSVAPTFGMMKKVFEIRSDGKEATHLLNAMEGTPDGLATVEEAAIALMGRLAKGPVRALSLRLGLDQAEVERGKPLRVEVSFTCLGRFPAEFPNPATFKSHPENSFRLNFWKPVKDEDGKPSFEYEWTLDLVGREFLTGEKTALRSSSPLLRLAPGATLTATTTLRFPKNPPGDYRVELIYITRPPKGSEGNSNLIAGEYHGDLVPLRVVK